MNQKLIQELRDNKIILQNDGTLDQLYAVLSVAFPSSSSLPTGSSTYYVSMKDGTDWTGIANSSTEKRIVSVKDFFVDEVEFKYGDEVYLEHLDKESYIYIATVPTLEPYSILLSTNKQPVIANNLDIVKKSVFKGTLKQIAEKLGVDEVIIEE